ncbi:hypothetical protein H7F33_13580 [Pedobacter sp. PAMC26386]|nr:hypothetical protein H7F33_13580 [Pedobacter sp. PAMC26386]
MKIRNLVNTLLKLLLIVVIVFGLQGRVIVRYADAFFHKGASTEQEGGMKTPTCRAKVVHCRLLCFEQDFQVITLPPAAFRLNLTPPSLVVVQAYQVLCTTKSLSGHEFRLLSLRAPPYC